MKEKLFPILLASAACSPDDLSNLDDLEDTGIDSGILWTSELVDKLLPIEEIPCLEREKPERLEGVTRFCMDADGDGAINIDHCVTTTDCFDGFVDPTNEFVRNQTFEWKLNNASDWRNPAYTLPQDCDDLDRTRYPGAVEILSDGIDQDCNGSDEPLVRVFFQDLDDDGYVNSRAPREIICPYDLDFFEQNFAYCRPSSVQVDTWILSGNEVGGDCNDQNQFVHPNAEEIPANFQDDNCDGFEICYIDEDQDRYGAKLDVLEDAQILSEDSSCSQPGVAVEALDCNDSDPDINPGQQENPRNNVDDNCRNGVDEVVCQIKFYSVGEWQADFNSVFVYVQMFGQPGALRISRTIEDAGQASGEPALTYWPQSPLTDQGRNAFLTFNTSETTKLSYVATNQSEPYAIRFRFVSNEAQPRYINVAEVLNFSDDPNLHFITYAPVLSCNGEGQRRLTCTDSTSSNGIVTCTPDPSTSW